MVLNITVGRTGRFDVGVSDPSTEVMGVQNVDVSFDWETKKIMHLQDTAKTTIMLLKKWSLNLTLTEDLADAGQDVIRTAYDAGTNIAFKLYPNYTDVAARDKFYTCSQGRCSKYSTKVDPMSEINASVTIDSCGVGVTMPV